MTIPDHYDVVISGTRASGVYGDALFRLRA
jgi:hypothetical protein